MSISASAGALNSEITINYPKKAKELPSCCIQLLTILADRPLFKGDKAIGDCKVITLNEPLDPEIVVIFNTNSQQILGRHSWAVHSRDDLIDPSGKRVENGLVLSMIEGVVRCSLKTLEESYNHVFNTMKSGWKSAKIEDHPGMFFTKDDHLFSLFIKKKSLIEESGLIASIARLFSMQDEICCFNVWRTKSGIRCNDVVYLWIKNSALDLFLKKFQFELTS